MQYTEDVLMLITLICAFNLLSLICGFIMGFKVYHHESEDKDYPTPISEEDYINKLKYKKINYKSLDEKAFSPEDEEEIK